MSHFKNRGVTLTEITISIAIIGLLLGATFGGYNLLYAAKIRRTISDFNNYIAAIKQFTAEYSYLPGDVPTAYNYWQTDCGANTSGAVDSCNGDGNGYIEYGDVKLYDAPQEDLLAWSHLALSEYIPGSYTGNAKSATERFEAGVNVPLSQAYSDDSVFGIRRVPGFIYGVTGHSIEATHVNDNAIWGEGKFIAKDGYAIDTKMDDGLADDGNFIVWKNTSATGCVTAAWNTTAASYDLDSEDKTCNFLWWYDKF